MNTQSLLAMVERIEQRYNAMNLSDIIDRTACERELAVQVWVDWPALSAAIRGMVMEREAVDGVRRAARALRDEFRMVDDPQSDDGTVSAWRVTQLMDAVDSLTSSAAKGDGK